jgi:hypothetical protein
MGNRSCGGALTLDILKMSNKNHRHRFPLVILALGIVFVTVFVISKQARLQTPGAMGTAAPVTSVQNVAPRKSTGELADTPAPGMQGTVRESSPAIFPTETVATRKMYAAHEPLRGPEIADADSEANRRILQTMVLKALQRQKTEAIPVGATP